MDEKKPNWYNHPPRITNVDDLCKHVGTDNEVCAQARIEAILDYLQDWGVIDHYNADRLDWIFSDNENN